MTASHRLTRSIGRRQAISLYIGAVVGAGVLVLPGAAASIAGPASILAWVFDALLGIPLAVTFGAMASRHPDAGGVSTYAARAFGPDALAAVGWFYLLAAAVGEIIVPLTGAYYAGALAGLGRGAIYLLSAAILIVTIRANLRGLKVSGALALCLSAMVALLLAVAAISALPRIGLHWTWQRASGFSPDCTAFSQRSAPCSARSSCRLPEPLWCGPFW